MIPSFSLKKPLTVVVAVLMVLVLGVVSFMNIQTDLLPTMEMPYVLVITVYPGATPEKVEQTVTKPLESNLATVGGVEVVQSTSSENVSMVILQFSYSTNMDKAMIELNNSLSSISASFDDLVQPSTMMQIDPDMLPIMVTSVSKEGADIKELTKLTRDIVLPALERVDGVASVSASGLLEHTIQVKLSPEKIGKVNEKVVAYSNKQAADALAELNKGKQALAEAEALLQKQKNETSAQLAEAGIAIADGRSAIAGGITALQSAITQAESLLPILNPIVEELGKLLQEEDLALFTERFVALLETAEPVLGRAAEILSGLSEDLAKLDPSAIDWTELENLLQDNPEALESLAGLKESLSSRVGEVTLSLGDLAESMKKTADQLAEMTKDPEADEALLATLQQGYDELVAVRDQMQQLAKEGPEQIKGLEEQSKGLSDQQKEVEKGKILLSTELATAASQIQSSKQALEEGEAQLEEALSSAAMTAGLDALFTESTIAALLTAQNFSMPAGYLTESGLRYTVKVGDEITDLADLEDLPLFVSDIEEIGTVTLADVAEISLLDNSEESFAKVNMEDGVLISLQKQSTASTNTVSENLKAAIAQIEEENPGVKVSTLMDQGVYIDIVIGTVLDSLIYGAIFAVLILFLFLKSMKSTMVVAVSIPVSLLLAMVLMYFSGVSMNIISLAGLALGVGMLVDNSIVVIENIYRLRSLGIPAGKAALEGAKQVSGAVTASTLTTVCVFLPIVFTEGLSKQLFTDMGLTIAYSLLASLLVALSVVPMMSATLLKKMKQPKKQPKHRLLNGYGKVLAFGLRQKWIPLLLAISLLGLSVYGTTQMGTAFIPDSITDELTMSVALPEEEEITTDRLREESLKVMEILCDIQDVETVGVYEETSLLLGSGGGSESMTLYIVLEEEKSRPAKEIVAEIKEKTADLPGCVCQLASSSSSMMSMMESGVSITVKGSDLDELQHLANQVADILTAQEGLTEVNNGLGDSAMELRISVNKEAAMKYSLTVAQVYQQVAAALTESTNATTLSMLEEEISVLLVKHDENKLTYEQLKEYPLTYTDAITGETNTVALSELAEISEATGMTSISHDNFVRRVNVTAAVEEGYNIGLISRELEEKIDGIELPDGYSLTISGENEMINSTLKDLILMILMAILMIYFIMVAQFQSFTGPFIVLFTIPLAMTGGLLALWIFGFELSVISMLGFLVLCGVVVNNGIVFVDTANQLQRKGMERRASLIEAGKMRMRPIFMTTITTVLGLVMLALGIGTGADMLQPMAVVVIFGLLYATLLTLFIVPVLCDGIFMRKPMGSIEVESELEVPDEYDDALPVMAAVQPNNKDAALEELPSAFKEPAAKEESKAEIKNDSCVIHLQSGPTVEISVRELIKKTPEVLENDRPAVEKADDQPREEKNAALQIAEEELPIFGI